MASERPPKASDPTSAASFPIPRRQWLAAAGLGGLGALWTDWLQAAAASPPTGSKRARSVILIFNAGAPSHIDLWDPKPNAPDEIRGIFKPIATSVPGIQISELMPRMARRADKLAIVRTLHHTHTSHNSAMYWSIVGQPYPIDSTTINPARNDFPSFGTLTGWLALRDGYAGGLPPYVITPWPHCDSLVYLTPGQYGSCLGSKFDPLVVNSDPNSATFQVPNLGPVDGMSHERLLERQDLLKNLEPKTRAIFSDASNDIDVNRVKAMNLVMTAEAQRAFDLTAEPSNVRDRYGRHTWGQSHLLARRLVEAGVPFVTTVNGPSIVWDTHQNNFDVLRNKLVPPMEQAYAALLDDLEERGLLDSTLVVWMGDFGRSPQINDKAGRDHWPGCYSMVLAGGGIRGGQVIGQSDKIGGAPIARPISPADIHATVFAALGHDSQAIKYRTADGRPMPLSSGEPIRELL